MPALERSNLRRAIRALAFGFFLLSLAGCGLPRGAAMQAEILRAGTGETPLFEVVAVTGATLDRLAAWPGGSGLPPLDWPKAHDGAGGSLIRPGDSIDVTIWDSQDNSLLTNPGQRFTRIEAVEVAANGEIFLPYVEKVAVAGLSPGVARDRIEAGFGSISPSAQVQLGVTHGRGHAVDAVGGVARPGAYPMPDRDYRILNLLADAGGISPSLRNPQIRLQRGAQTHRISAATLLDAPSRNVLLRPRDTLIVSEDDRSFVALGASGTEALIPFPMDRITALEALSLMGGLSDSRADPEGVLILRDYPRAARDPEGPGPAQQRVVLTFDLTSADGLFAARNFPIRSGDTVLATESPITNARTVLGLIGSAIGVSNRLGSLSE